MPRGLLLAFAIVAASGLGATDRLVLELRLFNGLEEVTGQARVTIHRAGDRTNPVAQIASGQSRLEVTVPQGIYDVQAIHEHEGRVVNIRWAERLVVMPYPDEGGHHLEVINFQNGFGALEVRGRDATRPAVTLYKMGEHQREVATAFEARDYVLFVVPAGIYDVQVRTAKGASWHNGIEVPLDRTRLWVVP